jgi:hypothetical protein
MPDSYKAVFLPIDERVLTLYKGYTLNGKMLPDLKKEDVYKETTYYEIIEQRSKSEQALRYIIIIPIVPLLIIVAIIAALFKKFDSFSKKSTQLIDSFFGFFFKKKKVKKTRSERISKYNDVVEEDVLEFLNHCRKNFAKIFIYSYESLGVEDSKTIENLIQQNLINSCVVISKLSELQIVVVSESISLLNSFIVIKDLSEAEEAKRLGVPTEYKTNKNIELWKRRRMSAEGGRCELEWNSIESLIEMKRNVSHYLEAHENLFFSNDAVFFIGEAGDPFLNDYISRNLNNINERLSKKNIQLIYFPEVKHNNSQGLPTKVHEFLRYHNPILYSFSDEDLQICLKSLIENLTAEEFYRLILEELKLPYFPKPCLLRNIHGGMDETINRFTYSAIRYSNEKDLNSFFEWYINQVKIPNDWEGVFYSLRGMPEEYDAEEYFEKESKADSEDLKSYIDTIKAQGKYGAIADALMYMLKTIKEERPELLAKVKPLIDRRKLLESKLVLSTLYVDGQKRIYLPDFGNIEVKMHALPKTVYLFFLQHPEGIRIKELYQYKEQLLEIYNTVTNKYENEEIKRAIDDLVDLKKPNINMQCSRIRAAFRNIMDEHVARYYYIDGLNGEPKKISLPHNLIDIRYI